MAAMSLVKSFPQAALGLSQLGQEEIGKSLTILSAFRLGPNDWKWFWSSWKDHAVKANRAFLYELISPYRIELHGKNGKRLEGHTKRELMPKEKEAAFYVNYDRKQGKFVLPEEDVSQEEVMNRIMATSNLAQDAFVVYRALEAKEPEFRYNAFSEIAFRLCSEHLYPQDMPAIYDEFRKRSERHSSLIVDMAKEIAGEKHFWQEMLEKAKSQYKL